VLISQCGTAHSFAVLLSIFANRTMAKGYAELFVTEQMQNICVMYELICVVYSKKMGEGN